MDRGRKNPRSQL